jgi:hypothetical protein
MQNSQPVPSEEIILADPTTEHIHLGGDSHVETVTPRTVTRRIALRDGIRRTSCDLTLYEEGFVHIEERRGARTLLSHHLNLRYLDPVPTIERRRPLRLLKAAGGCLLLALAAGLAAQFDAVRAAAWSTALVGGVGAFATVLLFAYLCQESVVFRTLHGRARALTLTAGLGYVRRLRAAVPAIVRAIEHAEEAIGDDTSVYLRAEMREHYRLRGDGVLSPQECSDSTERILGHFDDAL